MKKKILVIEDDKGIRDNLRILLEGKNYDVILASNGEEGVMTAEKVKPDLTLCDVMLPGIDGYDVIKKISGKKRAPMIPFIFLTAKTEHADLRRGMELGADDYIFKPFDDEELLQAIRLRLTKYEIVKAQIEDEVEHRSGYQLHDKILFRVGAHMESVFIDKILFITAERQYTSIFVAGKKHFVVKKSLKKWSAMLPAGVFLQIHRSTLVNMQYVTRVEKTLTHTYKISSTHYEKVFEVSRRFAKALKKFMPQQ
ncbi:MAG TPA: response regulator [Bacteroidota bacterium]|nr:response regulator [Bacteroidota bacterium]